MMAKHLAVQIPVLTGFDYEHVMCKADIVEDDNTVTITMVAKDSEARDLLALMTGGGLMALSFVAIPVTPRSTKSKENI